MTMRLAVLLLAVVLGMASPTLVAAQSQPVPVRSDVWWQKPWLLGVTGAAALGVGGPLLGFGARNKWRGGECASPVRNGGLCAEVYRFDSKSKAMLGFGVPLTAVGFTLVTMAVIGAATKNRVQVGIDVGASRFQLVIGRAL